MSSLRSLTRRSLSTSAPLLRPTRSSTATRASSRVNRTFFSTTNGRTFFSTANGTQGTKASSGSPLGAIIAGSAVAGAGLAFALRNNNTHFLDSPASPNASSLTPAERDARLKATTALNVDSPMRLKVESLIKAKQAEIVAALEAVDGKSFQWDSWDRPNNGGGGMSCVLQNGNVFEKAGVNISVVYGPLHPNAVAKMRADHKSLGTDTDNLSFFAAGLSMVLHPHNPNAPTVHLNYRYFETMKPDGTTNSWWFGGGTDLTPSYLFEEDAVHFHKTLKDACDKHDTRFYPRFKKWCDEYFYIKHRNETRGVGGIFFDDLNDREPEKLLDFITAGLDSFIPAYIPIIEKRKNMSFTKEQKEWQQVRRGRYVEFNLVYDRGTAFGLMTPGSRIESILMSLPVTASWYYMHSPKPRSREEEMLKVLQTPREWV